MAPNDDEEERLHSVALQNAQGVLLARRRAEDALRQQSEWLRITLASIGDAVISTDKDGRITFVNRMAEMLTGWRASEAKGRPLSEVFRIVHERSRQPVEDPAIRALREGTVVGLANHTILIARDGTERPIDDSAAPIRDESGASVGAVLVFRDITESKQAETAMARLAAIVESSEDAIISKTLDGIIVTWNTGAERLFGYTAEEAINRSIMLIIPPDHQDEEATILSRLCRGERIDHFETVRVAKDGRRVDISLSVSPLRDREGRILGASKIARDISFRKQAERAIRENEARYRAIVNATPECVNVISPDGSVLQMNSAGLAMIEADDPKEVLGRSVYNVIAPEHQERFRAFHQQICRGESGTLQFDFIGLKNTRRHMETSAVPLPEAGGRFNHLAVSRDITARAMAERALSESRSRLDYTVQLSGVGFWYCDLPFSVLKWDERVKSHFWLPPDVDVTIETFFERIHPDDRELTRLAIERSIQERVTFDTIYRTINPATGAIKWIRALGGAAFDPDGKPVRFDGVTVDATKIKLLEQELRQRVEDLAESDRKKDDFIALLAHELRNPLAPVRNGLQVMRLAAGNPEAIDQTRAMMDRQLGHMVRLIDDLLDVSRLNRNKMILRRSRVLLSDIINNAVETSRPVIEAAGHELILTLPSEPIFLDADLTRLAQVFGNLLTNSAKYTKRGGRIWLTAKWRNGEVLVTVRDTGIGIPPDALPSIFDMFSQVDRNVEWSTGGLGIGLALVKGLIEMHGGAVQAESAGIGQGSTFSVTLPARLDKPPEMAAALPEHDPLRASRRRRVLVVDDNRDSADSMAMMLELLGDEVSIAYDGVEAVEATQRLQPEIVLMDIGMPRLNGYEATRQIREMPCDKSPIIIALTGWGQESDRLRSKAAGCDGHLVKPVDLADLKRLLTEFEIALCR